MGNVARFAFGCVIGDDVACTDICLALFDIGIALCDIDAVGLVPFKGVIGLNSYGTWRSRADAAGGLCKCGDRQDYATANAKRDIAQCFDEIAIRSVHDVICFLSNRPASIPKILGY